MVALYRYLAVLAYDFQLEWYYHSMYSDFARKIPNGPFGRTGAVSMGPVVLLMGPLRYFNGPWHRSISKILHPDMGHVMNSCANEWRKMQFSYANWPSPMKKASTYM